MTGNLKKDYIWNTIGVFTQNAISPLLLVAITRINGIDISGLFSFAASVAIVFFAFGLWGGRTYQVSDARREFQHRSYIVARSVLAVMMILGAIIFSFVNSYGPEKTMLIAVLVLFKAIESIADSVYGILQVHDSLSRVGKSLFVKAVLGFGLFVVIDLWTHNILVSSLAVVVVNLVVFAFYDVRLARKLEDTRVKLSQLGHYTREAFTIVKRTSPVFAVTFLATFSINIPRFFIDKYDSDQIGYFGIIAMPITLIALLMSFILQPNVVNITNLYNRAKYQEFKRTVRTIVLITLVLGLIIIVGTFVLGVPVLNWIFGVDFTSHKNELLVMVAGGIANAVVAVYISILTIIRRFKAQFYILLVTNVVLAIVCAYIVQVHGMMGGVLLFAAANILQSLLMLRAYSRTLQTDINARRNTIKRGTA